MRTDRTTAGGRILEAPERNVAWILVISLAMFFVSLASSYLYSFPFFSGTANRDAWYYLGITVHLFFTLTLATSALCLARFAKKRMYSATIFFFAVSMILLIILGLRPLFG
jgi:high-affinity K+ transport system ATPase subunit B